MTKIATHRHPVRPPVPSVLLRVALDDVGDGESQDRYRVLE